ncbi:cupredoxin domain-containing protein [Bosea sp. (in: a-proteobacteria)]|uniref:cupredoxin domain-containing protein n=1 Tax=Bosea sp. (in: a-proteobacteria) TaxID=1871050 RepID=UPI002FCC6862
MPHLTRRAALLAMGGTMAALARPARAEARTHAVLIDKMRFSPMPSGARVGDTIIWTNRDPVRHTATARDKTFDVDLPANAEGRGVLTKAGSFDVICRFHPGMTAKLVVMP